MISANNVTLRVGKKALFEEVNIKFTEGNCYGLIGANGAGKSTFLKILSGQLEPTNGEVAITPGERLSFLQQDHFKYDEYPVLDTVIMGNARLYEIMKEKEAIYAKEDFTDEDGIKASELEGEFATMNGWEAESDAASLLNGLGIETDLHYKMMKDMTGPQKVKVLLAQALFGNPDILLLYEPTNHLDIDAIRQLENIILNEFKKSRSFVTITHDRAFLNRIVDTIWELDRGVVRSYPGSFEAYQRRKEEELAAEDKARADFDKVWTQEEAWIRRGIEARRTRNEGRVRRLEQMRIEREQRRDRIGTLDLNLDAGERSGKVVAELEGVSKSFGDRCLIKDLTLRVMRGDKLGLLGPNGVGKLSLIHI